MQYWLWFFKCATGPLLLIGLGRVFSDNTVANVYASTIVDVIGGGCYITALELYLYLSLKTDLRWFDD